MSLAAEYALVMLFGFEFDLPRRVRHLNPDFVSISYSFLIFKKSMNNVLIRLM
jgi:hypothetical protein